MTDIVRETAGEAALRGHERYVQEGESEAVLARIEEAPAVGTALITDVEVATALAQAVRRERMGRSEAREAERAFPGVVPAACGPGG